MRIISFSYTTPALLAGRKSVTRREWSDKYAAGFHKGDLIQAYNRSPRNGGERVAYIELTQDPYRELTWDMPDEDYDREGFKYFAENPDVEVPVTFAPEDGDWLEHFKAWRREAEYLWVIRFELLP